MAELAIVTGVSRGIGRACALALAERNVALALMGRASDGHEATVRDCQARGATVSSHVGNFCDASELESLCSTILEQRGTPTLVVNNAAELLRGPRVHEIAIEDWDRLMAVNLRAPFLITRALLPPMLLAERGRFIHIASVSGTIGCPQMAHYGSSKWALIGFSKSLADELRGTGLQSVAMLPGSVDTDMLKKTPFAPDMSAEAVAELVTYYGLDAPDAVNGAAVELVG